MQVNNTALSNKIVLVTRPESQALPLSALIQRSGGRPVCFPVIDIKPLVVAAEQQGLLEHISVSDIVIFISQNAVQQFFQQFTEAAALLQHKQILAVGDKTRHDLDKNGVTQAISSRAGMGSEAMLSLQQLQPEELEGKQVLIMKGCGGRTLLHDTLIQRGADVALIDLYKRHRPQTNKAQFTTIWNELRPDVMIFTSVEGLRNFFEMITIDELPGLFSTPVLVFGKRVASIARKWGFTRVSYAKAASDEALLQALYQL